MGSTPRRRSSINARSDLIRPCLAARFFLSPFFFFPELEWDKSPGRERGEEKNERPAPDRP